MLTGGSRPPVRAAQIGGTNADLIAEAGRLYLPPGSLVADVTYGSGRFWRKLDLTLFRLAGSDLHTGGGAGLAADFRHLPYPNGIFDAVVFDPPYTHHPSVSNGAFYPPNSTRYRNSATTASLYNEGIMELYREGMKEADRVMKPAGSSLLVKCQDQVQRDVQCWNHITIYEMAWDLGLVARDLFFLVPSGKPPTGRWKTQRHARQRPSYLWVFQKPDAEYEKRLRAAPPGSHGRVWWATHRG